MPDETTPPASAAPSAASSAPRGRRSFFFQPIKRPIWAYRWFHVGLGLALVLLLCSFILPPIVGTLRLAQPVLVPVVIGLAAAYVFNPLVTWLEKRRVARPVSAVSILVLIAGVLIGLAVIMGPTVVSEARAFARDFPDRAATLADRMGVQADNLDPEFIPSAPAPAPTDAPKPAPVAPPAPPTAPAPDAPPAHEGAETPVAPPVPPTAAAFPANEPKPAGAEPAPGSSANRQAIKDWIDTQLDHLREQPIGTESIPGKAVAALGYGWLFVTKVMSWSAYLAVGVVVASMCFVVFSWHFNAVCAWPVPFIPVEYRAEVLRLARACDKSIQAFIRGRLVQAAIFAVLLSVGWFLCGVPYAILIGLAGGLLALLPYLAVLALPMALGLLWIKMVGPHGDGLVWWKLLMPALVYAGAQILDGWLVEPYVQGKATGLSPLAVLLAVMLGAALGGVVGVVLAIPTAACVLILWREALLPRLKALADGAQQQDAGGAG